ncbi:MAG: hypothetical protein EZS28_001296 [Streblomastix strix]|uniref:Uncharacterized protein n=1 Tax=Streblomastix strix TaxID=222440 RepID=A0A5J4X7E7_9EUKA|nr:MAG: hypothetical protein EZS28_001296 [Streblomastix strix]
MESEGIHDRKNKIGILPSEKTLTANHNNPHPKETELNNKLTHEIMQIRGLHNDGLNNTSDLQDMELHAIDRRIRTTTQQTKQQLSNSRSQRLGDAIPQRVQLQMEESQIIHPSTNTSIKQSVTENEIRQSTGNNNSTDLAGTIIVHQTKEFTHQILFTWIFREKSGDGTENERLGSKASTRQSGHHASGPVADVGRDILMRRMKLRGFSEEGVSLLFNRQSNHTVEKARYL